jgi:hypothetical protein
MRLVRREKDNVAKDRRSRALKGKKMRCFEVERLGYSLLRAVVTTTTRH